MWSAAMAATQMKNRRGGSSFFMLQSGTHLVLRDCSPKHEEVWSGLLFDAGVFGRVCLGGDVAARG